MKKNIAKKFQWDDDKENSHPNQSYQYRLSEIINGCRKQESRSQEELYKLYYGYAMGVALTYSQSRDDALEVVNDSFMKVFKHIMSYKSEEPFKPWIRKIVVNTSIDKARADKRFNQLANFDETDKSSAINVETELNAKQIYLLLNELPDLLRFVFNMYEIEGYSHREISNKLDIAESSSRTYLTRAKAQLRLLYKHFFQNEPWISEKENS